MRPSKILIAAGVALLAGAGLHGQTPQTSRIYTAEIDGIIHPVAAEYIAEVIAKADAANAALVVITLRTPGGLVDSTRDINNAIIHAKTPVAVFVGPSGNRAASAGFLITIAADIAAMSKTSLFEQATVVQDVRFITDRTIYSRIGDVVAWLSLGLTVAALLSAWRLR